MRSATLTLLSSASLWYLLLFAALPSGNSEPITCDEAGCKCDNANHLISCFGLNLSFVPHISAPGVHSFNLSTNQIRDVNDDDFVQLTELRYLDFSHNLLSNISANAFSGNIHLRSLVLEHNYLNGDDVLSAGKMTSLRELYLSGNRIDDVDKFTVFSSLSTLDVSKNELVRVPETFLADLPNLRRLVLSGNRIEEFVVDVPSSSGGSMLRELNLSSNSITRFSISGQLRDLEVLDLSWNRLLFIDPDSLASLPNLLVLVVSGNPFEDFPDFAFQYLTNLKHIEVNYLQNLATISENVFAGLRGLRRLELAHNSRLRSISSLAFVNLTQLRRIDLSDNSLSSLSSAMFGAQQQLEVLDISENPWPCNCVSFGEYLALEDMCRNSSCALKVGTVCWGTEESSVANQTSDLLDCRKPRVLDYERDVRHELGSSAVLDCPISGYPPPQIVWTTNRNVVITFSVLAAEQALVERFLIPGVDSYLHQYEQHDRMSVLPNGSLYIAYVTRKEGGTYQCIASNEYGNATAFVEVQLNYQIMSTVTVSSIIVGFMTATGFFFIAVIIGVVRYLSFVCSRKERRKRKSIREVLETIQDYKSAQFDKLTAYKTAKMDQLSAFKSAKIDQFSAFRHSRIDKLRTYKQATVTSVLQYLERMREHYTNQTVRIKDNCAQQMEKLRESYGVRRGRFKDYRSHQVEKMRDNYNAQVLKIREYSVQQMSRLREQYKAQQQNMLKLLELLDVGNCVTVIEAECIHTESVIFDASIAFDFEAHPIHGPRDTDSTLSGESHYLTASESGSESDLATNPHSISFAADVEPPGSFPDFPPVDSFDDSTSDIFLESFSVDDTPMEFPEMPDIPGIVMPRRKENFLERETEC